MTRQTKRYDKALKKARDRFNSPKTRAALEDAIGAISGATVFDSERILTHLRDRLSSFKDAQGFKEFRARVIAFAIRQAELAVQLRGLLDSADDKLNATVLFSQLPEFTGDVNDTAALLTWAVALSNHVKRAGDELAAWMRDNSASVRSGIRRVTANCTDLEGCIEDVEDELFSETWMHVAENAEHYVGLPNLRKSLHIASYWRARAWKTKRLRALRDGSSPKPVVIDNFEAIEAEVASLKEQRKCPPRPITLGTNDGQSETTYTDTHNDKIRMWTGAIDLNDFHNPIIIEEPRWTDFDLARELRRAGPFRVDDTDVSEQIPMAA